MKPRHQRMIAIAAGVTLIAVAAALVRVRCIIRERE